MKMRLFGLVGVLAMAMSCNDYQPNNAERAMQHAAQRAANRNVYNPTHDVEFNNYNRRQELADDPTALLWCTTAFPFPGSPMITIPIVGKLTSGAKRPYATQQSVSGGTGVTYNPELPGPDGMYGSSGEYRYGFTPTGTYVDFYGMSVFCTTEPMVFQREATRIVMNPDRELLEAHNHARDALRAGNGAEAGRIMQEALQQIDSAHSPAAARPAPANNGQ